MSQTTDPTVATAAEFFAWEDAQGHWRSWTDAQQAQRSRLFYSLPPNERYTVHRGRIETRILDAEETGTAEHRSPSGRYRLRVTSYSFGPSTWSYTRGEVFRTADGERVANVLRNYGNFVFSWLEEHRGHDYLICGEDYQGQTFCQLDTAQVRSHIPNNAFSGVGFCWAAHWLLPDGQTLVVDGCYWVCPYEYRFFDVSAPMEGWPELMLPEPLECVDINGDLTWEDGCIVWRSHASERVEAGGHRIVLRRVGQTLELVEEWKSASQLAAEAEEDE